MNKKIKVGDIVVLAEADYVDGLLTILEKEKHLFEVEGWAHEVINLKSISTNIKARVYGKSVRHATLKEQYLRTGNVVKVKSGATFIVIDNYITNHSAWDKIDNFNDDLTNEIIEGNDIVEVYNFNSLIRNGNRIGTLNMMLEVNEHSLHKLIWERKPKIELTSDEVVILKNIDKKYKYFVRDGGNNGSLFVYETKPVTSDVYDEYFTSDDTDFEYLGTFNHLFQNITFESGAHLIADLIKENEK